MHVVYTFIFRAHQTAKKGKTVSFAKAVKEEIFFVTMEWNIGVNIEHPLEIMPLY